MSDSEFHATEASLTGTSEQFSFLKIIQDVRAFRDSPIQEVLGLHFYREPGNNLSLSARCINQVFNQDPGIEVPVLNYFGIDIEEGTEPLGRALLGALYDGVEINFFDEEEPQYGDVQAEELIIKVLDTGFALLANNPYFEVKVNIVRDEETNTIVVYVLLCRMSFDKEHNQRVSTVLINTCIPLVDAFSINEDLEPDDSTE